MVLAIDARHFAMENGGMTSRAREPSPRVRISRLATGDVHTSRRIVPSSTSDRGPITRISSTHFPMTRGSAFMRRRMTSTPRRWSTSRQGGSLSSMPPMHDGEPHRVSAGTLHVPFPQQPQQMVPTFSVSFWVAFGLEGKKP